MDDCGAARPSQVDLAARQREAGRGLVISSCSRQRYDLRWVLAFSGFLLWLAPCQSRAAEGVVGGRSHLAVQKVTVVIAHVPVAVSAAKRAQRIAVGHGQSLAFSTNDHAGLRAPGAACTLTVTLVVVAAEVVVIVSWCKSRKPRGVAAVALTLSGRRANGHPTSVRVAELIALSRALSRQSHVWQLSGIWIRRTEREKY